MKYRILRNNTVVAEVSPQGEVTEKLFGEEAVTMSFTLNRFVKFQIGDSVAVYGKTYYISREPAVDKVSSREFKYDLNFESVKYRLAEVQYFFYDEQNQLTMPEFSIMGTAEKMVQLVVANANRVQGGWTVGQIDTTDTILVDFSGYNCLAALTRIAEEFKLELWIDANKSIHLTERKAVSGYTLQYGRSKGLKNISRTPFTEADLVTRLYAKGADKNIPKGYRNGQKHLRMNVPYLQKNTDKYGIIEHTKNFDEIYPKRVGTVTGIVNDNPLQFIDADLDFDLNAYNQYGSTVLIAGVSAKVIFQTGDLAGYTFEIKQYGYNSATKTFTLLKNKDEKSFEIPSQNFRPRVGDKYILVDIMMPASYVEQAEQELKEAAQEYLDKNSRQRFVYSVEPDPLYLKQIQANFVLGNTIRFKDADFGLNEDIRIIGLTKDLQNPYKISFEIAEQATITQIVRNYIENEKKETAIKKEQKYNAQMARRSWLFAEEIKNNVFDNDGYFDTQKIKPLSIETGHLQVGARAQQFSLPDVALTLSHNNTRLKNTAGRLEHLTINENAPRTWNIAQNETPPFSANFNYIYLKADKIGNNAVFIVTEQKLLLDADPIFYYFLVGSVSSEIDGVRRIKTSYGFTQITPGEISTGRISSANGSNWIDLLQDRIEINAKVQFTPDSPAIQQVSNHIAGELGTLAWESTVEKAQLGNTIIQGGYIRTELLNASAIVSSGGGVTNTALQNAIHSIAVGGRNLIRNTAFKNNGEKWIIGYPSVQFDSVHRRVKIPHYTGGSNEIQQYTKCVPSASYTVSFKARGNSNYFAIYFLERKGNAATAVYKDNFTVVPISSELKEFKYTFTTQPDADGVIMIFRNIVMGSDIWLEDIKLEKGNKATDWTPAPEDLDEQFIMIQNGINNMQTSLDDVKTKTDNFTSIQGGLISSNIISVGDSQVNQNAFISGVTDAGGMSVRFGAGANYANKSNAPFRVLDNGKMIAMDAEIHGKIEATHGKIGSFNINNGLQSSTSLNNHPWEPGTEYLHISPNHMLLRKNGGNTSQLRQAFFGATNPISSGVDGAVGIVMNTMDGGVYSPFLENIALRVEARNSQKENVALEVKAGNIKLHQDAHFAVKNNGAGPEYLTGYTGDVVVDKQTYYYGGGSAQTRITTLIIKKGIITDVNITTRNGT